jgi:hypothetical protein
VPPCILPSDFFKLRWGYGLTRPKDSANAYAWRARAPIGTRGKSHNPGQAWVTVPWSPQWILSG